MLLQPYSAHSSLHNPAPRAVVVVYVATTSAVTNQNLFQAGVKGRQM
jgi:hypothetical protein